MTNIRRSVLVRPEDEAAIIASVAAAADYQDRIRASEPHDPLADPLTPEQRAKVERVFREIHE